jgi:hypothetical protein
MLKNLPKSMYVTPGGLTAATDGDVLVADYGAFAIVVGKGAVTTLARFSRGSIAGVHGVFRPSGVAAVSIATVYADTDGVNGGAEHAALRRMVVASLTITFRDVSCMDLAEAGFRS